MSQQIYATITPSDTAVIGPALTAIWVTTAGNLAFRGKGDANPVTVAVGVGLLVFPFPVDRIMATNTTAVVGVGCQAAEVFP